MVVRLYLPWERPSQSHSLEQIASALANHCTVGGYCWPYLGAEPEATVLEALALADRAGVWVPVLWLDCEEYGGRPGPGIDWLVRAADECERYGAKAGIYTRRDYWQNCLADTAALAELPLWAAQYRGGPRLEDVDLFGGWPAASGKQWTVDEGDAGDVDLDIFRADVT